MSSPERRFDGPGVEPVEGEGLVAERGPVLVELDGGLARPPAARRACRPRRGGRSRRGSTSPRPRSAAPRSRARRTGSCGRAAAARRARRPAASPGRGSRTPSLLVRAVQVSARIVHSRDARPGCARQVPRHPHGRAGGRGRSRPAGGGSGPGTRSSSSRWPTGERARWTRWSAPSGGERCRSPSSGPLGDPVPAPFALAVHGRRDAGRGRDGAGLGTRAPRGRSDATPRRTSTRGTGRADGGRDRRRRPTAPRVPRWERDERRRGRGWRRRSGCGSWTRAGTSCRPGARRSCELAADRRVPPAPRTRRRGGDRRLRRGQPADRARRRERGVRPAEGGEPRRRLGARPRARPSRGRGTPRSRDRPARTSRVPGRPEDWGSGCWRSAAPVSGAGWMS